MKNLNAIKLAFGFIFSLLLLSSCDKYQDDQLPAGTGTLVVHDDAFTTFKNQGIQVNVIANDSIGSQATVNFTQPQHGTLQAGTNGMVHYQPNPNFVGTDKFNYTACLGNNCATGLVAISVIDSTGACTVSAMNDLDTLANNYGSSVSIDILQNDNVCGATPGILQQPSHGLAYLDAGNFLVYKPNPGYLGMDQVKYQLTGQNGTATALVNILVLDSAYTCTVVARDDNATVTYNGSVTVNILTNDNSCGGSPSIAVFPNNGQAYININGQLVYTPIRNFSGRDELTYSLSGPNGSTIAKVYLTVSAPTCLVKANPDYATLQANTSVTVNILQNDNTCLGTSYYVTPGISQQPLYGQAYINANNQLVYTPNPGYVGPDEVLYNLTGNGNPSNAKVYFTVTPNQNPNCSLVANPDSVTLRRVSSQSYDTVSVAILQNDVYCQNGTFPTVQIVYQPNYGRVSIVNNGLATRIIYSTTTAPRPVRENFRYRICQTINGQQVCRDADIDIYIR
ncbi:Ig-like domain-containing protein [Adhaeribacter soli]|uniref:Tandem-95 repeat protein n=1 Tax=Adhaeribacter soli TaxID=2607655 RepID=A0A5N1J4H7_9BACT|nr:Ig-like domain-containing protein [Adhaeribacter soli]KAA9345584.1 tandem-95 repeat protein [Adhaeribacter soli]